MSTDKLQEKIAYFEQQELADISDDENEVRDEAFLKMGRELADLQAMPAPPKFARHPSSFLGPTPKEQQRAFEAAAAKRPPSRPGMSGLKRSATAPDVDVTNPVTKRRRSPDHQDLLKRTTSLPDIKAQDDTPFYIWVGEVPREMKKKNAKPADNIKLEPEAKQILRGKIVYFYPNDDISMARRLRIHKCIQLGAAWTRTFRADISHVMFDEGNHSYAQFLRHINKAGISKQIVMVKFNPYIPQSIQLGLGLLDPTAGRFLVEGSPTQTKLSVSVPASQFSASQGSLQIKSSERQLAAHQLQETDSVPKDTSSLEIVKDSFSYEEPPEPEDTYNDALSKAIQETKAIAHLPLDEEEDDASSPTSNQDSDISTDDEDPEPVPKRPKPSKLLPTAPKDQGKIPSNAFQCMNPLGSKSSTNPNARTIKILDQMCKYYDQMQDQWRTLAYRKAITTLRKQTTKITTAKQAAALPFIGTRLADKIEEIVLTSRLRRLDNTRSDATEQVLRLFLGVYGAGLVQANKWIQAGHRTLADLIAKAKLTDSQKIGIAHYTDFAQRIPRTEVEAHGNFIQAALKTLDPEFEATIMGSYRRGATDCGDIDVLITKPSASIPHLHSIVFGTLIPSLTKSGFLKCKLATSSKTDDNGTKWHGVSCLPDSKIWRRLDILLVPSDQMGAALLYFTGNDIFNRSIRLLASKKGMQLNQRGLYKDVFRGRNREKLNEGTLVEGRSEKRIFEILGVPWREPTERIC